MALVFHTLKRAAKPELLNEEWMIVENTGPGVLSSGGWTIEVGKGPRTRPLGTLKPGFMMQAGEKVRLITGTASKKAQGTPPSEDQGVKNYYLFLREPVLTASGLVLHVKLNQMEVARATFDPDAKNGIAQEG